MGQVCSFECLITQLLFYLEQVITHQHSETKAN